MANPILVIGGTGTVGRVVVEKVLDAGRQVHVLSRGRRPTGLGRHLTSTARPIRAEKLASTTRSRGRR